MILCRKMSLSPSSFHGNLVIPRMFPRFHPGPVSSMVMRREQSHRRAVQGRHGTFPRSPLAIEDRPILLVPISSRHKAPRRRVARMFAVSTISTMNVESPRESLSEAPTRVKMRFHADPRGFRGDEGTDLRHKDDEPRLAWVRRLPAMFGPGDETSSGARKAKAETSFGTKFKSGFTATITGWNPPRISMPGASETSGLALKVAVARRDARL